MPRITVVVNDKKESKKKTKKIGIISKVKFNFLKDKKPRSNQSVARKVKFNLVTGTLPVSVDLTNFCSPIEDQGQLGACSGHAFAGVIEYLENKTKIFLESNKFSTVSRLMIYYNERVLENDTGEDAGATITDGIKSLKKYGVCVESMWPYDISKFSTRPLNACYQDGLKRRIKDFASVDLTNNDLIQRTLASGYPIVIGIMIYDSFETDTVAKTGIVPMPGPDEQLLGGHAVAIYGYNKATKQYLARNSWGPNWGIKGYFFIPFDYINDPNLASDAWVITD